MGRYPFMTAVNDYLALMKDVLKETTLKEYERRYRRMHKDLLILEQSRKISTTNIKKMREEDVLAYLASLRARGMKDTGIAHNVDALAAIMRFMGNNALERAKLRSPQHFPRFSKPRYDPISNTDRAAILDAADLVQNIDWKRMQAYAIAIAGICTGLRPGELRKAKIGDLDLKKGILHAEEVKGKDRYGEPRNAAIHPSGLPFLRRYAEVRNSIVVKKDPTNEYLFPAIWDSKTGGDGCFSQQSLSRMRRIVSDETGVSFDGRACRRTFGQVCIDSGVPLDAVSRMMGHKTTKTTETYYCRRSNDAAIQEAQRIWGKLPNECGPTVIKPKTPLIENRYDLSGYV